jgi:hypothetical protein
MSGNGFDFFCIQKKIPFFKFQKFEKKPKGPSENGKFFEMLWLPSSDFLKSLEKLFFSNLLKN